MDASSGSPAADLARLDGLSLHSKALPHQVDLLQWSDAGLYRLDLDALCLRLTDAGRRLVAEVA